jgi:hypothetical protein
MQVRNALSSSSALNTKEMVPCLVHGRWTSERNVTSPQVQLFNNNAAPATKIPTDTMLF